MTFNGNKNYVTLVVMLDQGLCFIPTDCHNRKVSVYILISGPFSKITTDV